VVRIIDQLDKELLDLSTWELLEVRLGEGEDEIWVPDREKRRNYTPPPEILTVRSQVPRIDPATGRFEVDPTTGRQVVQLEGADAEIAVVFSPDSGRMECTVTTLFKGRTYHEDWRDLVGFLPGNGTAARIPMTPIGFRTSAVTRRSATTAGKGTSRSGSSLGTRRPAPRRRWRTTRSSSSMPRRA
jgi:hypothetical protein